MQFTKKYAMFLIIVVLGFSSDIFTKYITFKNFHAVILPDGRKDKKTPYLFSLNPGQYGEKLNKNEIDANLREEFKSNRFILSEKAEVKKQKRNVWMIKDQEKEYLLWHEKEWKVYFYSHVFWGDYIILPKDYRPYPVIAKCFNIRVAFNRGAVWGSFEGQTLLLTLFSLGAIAFIGYLTWKNNFSIIYQIVLGLILAGAFGNLWDRLFFGGVRDFLDMYLGNWHWPTYNLADVYILTGIGAFLLLEWKREEKKPDEEVK